MLLRMSALAQLLSFGNSHPFAPIGQSAFTEGGATSVTAVIRNWWLAGKRSCNRI